MSWRDHLEATCAPCDKDILLVDPVLLGFGIIEASAEV